MKLTRLSLAIAALLSMSAVAYADPAASADPDADQASSGSSDANSAKQADQANSTSLEAITVTARRREETLQDVPIAITALSARTLETLNVQNLGDLQGNVPNMIIHDARGSNSTITTYIRGIGQSDPTWGSDPGVGLYLDDVYIARPQGALLDVFDVQRIEVLRGPQGTLYGKNTIGGAIKYVSRPLSTQEQAYAEADVGNEGQKNVKLGLGGASDDGVWRGRVAYASLHDDGYGENLVTGVPVSNQNTNAGRVSLGFFPKDVPFEALFSADTVHDNSYPRGAKRLNINKFDPAKTPPNESDYDVQSGMAPVNQTHMVGEALTLTYYGSNSWTYKSITAHRQSNTDTNIDFDTLQPPIADVGGYYHDWQNSEELQATYQGDSGTSGVIGFYYFNGLAGGTIKNDFLGLLFGVTGGSMETRSYAGYTDWTWQLNDRWNLSAGARFTSEEKHAIVNNYSTDPTFTVPKAVSANFDKSRTSNNVSPRVSLQYKLTEETNLYGSLGRGFKSGGYNIRANTAAVPDASHPIDDEDLTTLEFGSKSNFDDGKFSLNADVFYTKYKNVQLSVFTSYTLPDGTQGFFGDFTNAGKAHAYGIEAEFAWRPIEHWAVIGNIAGLHTEFDEYLSGGINVADQKRFNAAPNGQFGANLEYSAPVDVGGNLRARVGWTYQTRVFPTTDLSPAIAQGPYGVLGAGVIWDYSAHWTFGLHGSNLTDKSYRTDGYNIPSLAILTGFYGAPRLILGTVKYTF
jgi:iron complex outermembrane receptor protein